MPCHIVEVTVGNTRYKVKPHGLADRNALEKEAAGLAKSPVDRLKEECEKFAPETARALALQHFPKAFRETEANWPPRFGSPSFMEAFLKRPGGFARLLLHALRALQPRITLAECEKLAADAYGEKELDDALGEIVVRFLVRELPDDATPQEIWRGLSDQDGTMEAARELALQVQAANEPELAPTSQPDDDDEAKTPSAA